MFTGIIEEVGRVKAARRSAGLVRLEIEAKQVCGDTKIGDSICVSGVCLTVVEFKDKIIAFEVMTQTLRETTLAGLRPGDELNLERALKAGDRIGGHFVTGHVDFTGVIRQKIVCAGNLELRVGVPAKFLKLLIPRGSVTVDGISLTIARVSNGAFVVCVIPHTARVTTLGRRRVGEKVNVEIDILAKRA